MLNISHSLRILFCALLLSASSVGAQKPMPAVGSDLRAVLSSRLDSLLMSDVFERTQVAISVYDLTDSCMLYAHNERQLMRPASCQKIITAVAALMRLGVGYEYVTRLYVDGSISDSVLMGSVCVRGGFDPLFDADDMQSFMATLKGLGIDSISGNVVLDVSMKDTLQLGWGWCWDDEATPLSPLLYNGKDIFAPTFAASLSAAGIGLSGNVLYGSLPASAAEVSVRSHGLEQVLIPMMKDSHNNMAESMFYQLAAIGGQPYAGRKQAASQINSVIAEMGFDPDHYQVADGSGLSLYNYTTAQLLLAMLRKVHAVPSAYSLFRLSLPLAGSDGTLSSRMTAGSAYLNVRAKTGTVAGVSSLAGYCTAANGHELCFVIINNGLRRGSTGRAFQDRVCQALTAPLAVEQPVEAAQGLPDSPPEFPGGMQALMAFVGSHTQYPAEAMKKGIEGSVVVRFVVETDGSVGNVQVAKSLSPDCDSEAVRVVKSMPRFKPAIRNGEAVPVTCNVPFRFKMAPQ